MGVGAIIVARGSTGVWVWLRAMRVMDELKGEESAVAFTTHSKHLLNRMLHAQTHEMVKSVVTSVGS